MNAVFPIPWMRFPPRWAIFVAGTALVLWLPACEEDVELPPENSPRAVAAEPPDLKHAATIRADRTISIPSVILVVQFERTSGELAMTLTSRQPAGDGSRLVFGAFEKAKELKELVGKEVSFGGGPFLDPTGAGVFTPICSYQPKLAALRLTRVEGDEAEGRFSGDFYVFNPTRPKLKPDVIRMEGTFAARIVQK